MSTYVLLSTLTGEGARTMHSNPARMMEVNKEIEAFGCKVKGQYALLGDHDFLTMVEATDNETIAHLSADLASRGTIKITTYPAVEVGSLIERMKKPHKLGHS
jgi:uncharacterized protein with GYD domain